MTLDDAMQTTISMRGKSFVPPPRSIDNILDVITTESTKEGLFFKEWNKLLKTEAPKDASRTNLIEFYIKRARVAESLGYLEHGISDMQQAYNLSMPEKFDGRIINIWAGCELKRQNYEKAVALYNILKEKRSMKFLPYAQLAFIYAITGRFEEADSVRDEAINMFGSWNLRLNASEEVFKARLDAIILKMRAKYQEAEAIMRKAVESASFIRPHRPDILQVDRIRLTRNLIDQNRLIEAELEARTTIQESIKFLGAESVNLLAAYTTFAQVLLAQGRLIDAEKITVAAIKAYEQFDLPSTFGWRSFAIETLGKIFVAKGEYSDALKQWEFFLSVKESNPYVYDAFYSNNKEDFILSLIMIHRYEEAIELIEDAYQKSINRLGKNHLQSAELLALRGMANNSINNLESAYLDFAEAIPLIAKSKTYSENRLSRQRFMLILDSYISLLSKIRGSIIEKNYSFYASSKAFEASMLLSDSEVQTAALASIARMSINDPRLKEIVRAEQDIQQQIIAYQNLIKNLLSRPADDKDLQAITNIKIMLDKLRDAREVIVDEIERRFPDYANLVNYRQPTLDDIQSRLKPEEVIIAIYSTENCTYVFAIPPTGLPEMVTLQIAKKNLEELVSGIKKSLSPSFDRLGHLPAYDFVKAYELYSMLIKPTEEMWTNSKHMILSVSGPLMQLPFSVITTEPFQLQSEKEVLFSSYREAPWLIKRISINTVPSVSSFVALRERPKAVDAKEVFVGFGDPIFNKTQIAQAINEKKIFSTRKPGKNTKMDIRGIRLTKDGTLDNKKLLSCKVETLERLPDTADELLSIAEALGANPVKDIYLGRQASEKQVKSMDLSDRRVVAFASHALVPYDLDGLDQPAIALSAPSVTGDEDDGLLTMAEILDLKLNADWVVLSACNTGAADGAGAEAVSGLGRAFFYAGTRAVLVSMWPVETSSAKKLTTALFQHLKENPRLTKAQAHQRAMLDLIDRPGMLDEEGRIIASYAHPFFWAPFITVGDNGTTNLN